MHPMVEHVPGLCKALAYIPKAKGRGRGGEENGRISVSYIVPHSVEDGLCCSASLS